MTFFGSSTRRVAFLVFASAVLLLPLPASASSKTHISKLNATYANQQATVTANLLDVSASKKRIKVKVSLAVENGGTYNSRAEVKLSKNGKGKLKIAVPVVAGGTIRVSLSKGKLTSQVKTPLQVLVVPDTLCWPHSVEWFAGKSKADWTSSDDALRYGSGGSTSRYALCYSLAYKAVIQRDFRTAKALAILALDELKYLTLDQIKSSNEAGNIEVNYNVQRWAEGSFSSDPSYS